MTTLGIETSCDETALALIETRGSLATGDFEVRVINSLVHSQADLHSAYGGVYPNLAKREHQKNIEPLLKKLLENFDTKKIDQIAVTEGPGLEPALWVGIEFARKLGEQWQKPVIPINHMEGHVVGSLLKDDRPLGAWQTIEKLETPAIALLISGGHTELVKIELLNSKFEYQILGQTKDDAVGEAFDKVARLLGLPYPGGPHLSLMAAKAREAGIESKIKLPRPMINSNDLDFSFSGLKTAVLYALKNIKNDEDKRGLSREFEDSVKETLDAKLRKAIEISRAQAVIVGGGVIANTVLRETFEKTANEYGIPLFLPTRHASGDNALMIALAGALNGRPSVENRPFKAKGTWRLSEIS